MKNFSRHLFVLVILAIYFLVSGCGGDEDSVTSPTSEPLASETIGSEGGILDGGDVLLIVPPNALAGDTDLAIHLGSEAAPFGSTNPTYRLTGLPENLNKAVSLRILNPDPSVKGSNMVFMGEERESLHSGRTNTWYHVAPRDSAQWFLLDLERGAYSLGDRAEGGLSLTTIQNLEVAENQDPGNFTVYFNPAFNSREFAQEVLASFDEHRIVLEEMGFDTGFGDELSHWPVYLRAPEYSQWAEYIVAPWSQGHFNLDPGIEGHPIALERFVLHELFHCAQDLFDTRDPSTWKTVNPEMRWIDEATASWLDASGNPDWVPVGLNINNYVVPVLGITVPDGFPGGDFGYGMSTFIKYLMDHQGAGRLLALFEAFSEKGTATDALMDIMDPALEHWCADFHKQLSLQNIYQVGGADWVWELWNVTSDNFRTTGGTTESIEFYVMDFGMFPWKAKISDTAASANSSFVAGILENQDPQGFPLNLALFGKTNDGLVEFLAEGTNEVVYEDWPHLVDHYEEIMVQIVRPFGVGPLYDEVVQGVLGVGVVENSAELPPFNKGRFMMQIVSQLVDGTIVPSDTISQQNAAGTFSGNSFSAVWDTTNNQGIQLSGELEVNLGHDPLRVLNWSYEWLWTYPDPGSYTVYQVSGGETPLYSTNEDLRIFRLSGEPLCESLTHVYFIEVLGDVVQQELESYSCNSNSYLNIYLGVAEP